MKRSVKNIVQIILVMICIAATIGYMYYLKNNTETSMTQDEKMQDDMAISQGQNRQDAPEIPSGDMSGEVPDDVPTDMPDNMGDGEVPDDVPNDMGTEIPDDIPSDDMQGQMPDDMQNMDNDIMPISEQQNSITLNTIDYAIFALLSLIISVLVIYIVMSKFNAKTFKETFTSSDKVVIMILLAIILTALITLLDVFAVNKLPGNDIDGENKMQNEMGTSSSSIVYSAVLEITEDTELTSGTYSSSNSDEIVILVDGEIDVSISDVIVEKTGDSDGGDDTSFYGINSAIVAKSGATLNLSNMTITTAATGANGVFSYGGSATTSNTSSDGTTVNISDSTITTTGDNSGGIMTTGGGITNAYNLTVNTAGVSSAAIRSDRGGGTVTVDGGTYTTTGAGSPTVYSTADITVENATLISNTAEGIVVEGKNSVVLENCDLTDSNTKLNGQSTTYKNIFLYQSMSGDADDGTSSFSATNCNITTNNGDTLYVTNTTAVINLENNYIVNNNESGNFLRVQKDSWGNSGTNGGEVTLTLTNQNASGNIVIDSISTLDMTISEGSVYEGTINGTNEAKSITLKLDSTSNIKLTGDSYITNLDTDDTSYSNIDFNGYTLYVNGVAIN